MVILCGGVVVVVEDKRGIALAWRTRRITSCILLSRGTENSKRFNSLFQAHQPVGTAGTAAVTVMRLVVVVLPLMVDGLDKATAIEWQ